MLIAILLQWVAAMVILTTVACHKGLPGLAYDQDLKLGWTRVRLPNKELWLERVPVGASYARVVHFPAAPRRQGKVRHRTQPRAAAYRFLRQHSLGRRKVALSVTGLSAANVPSATDQAVLKVLAKTERHSNLGMLLKSVERRMGHLPMSTMTVLPGSDEPKVIFKTSGRDNIGLNAFASAFKLPKLREQDCLLIEANGVRQETINRLVAPYIKRGYRPVGTRMLLRAYRNSGAEAPGAAYIRCIAAMLGSFTNVRSYFSLGSAPALHQFEVPAEGLSTDREGGEAKEILWFAGKAKEIFPDLDGTEGGLLTSEKAMEKLYGSKKPAQPRMALRLDDGEAVLFKGNHTVVSARAFLDEDGQWYFLTRGDFADDDQGVEAWRQGHDFVLLEDDSPKGDSKAAVKVEEGIRKLDVNGKLFGWLIAQANDKQGSSLVSYQVLALIAQSNGWDRLAERIERLVSKSVDRSVAMVARDLEALELDEEFCRDLELLKEHLAAKAPNSAREARKNHLGFGAKMSTGYIHMSNLINPGVIVVGDHFGLTPGQIKRDAKKGQPVYELTAGGKNPILDHQQVFIGKAVRLETLNKLRSLIRANRVSEEYEPALQALFGGRGFDRQRIEQQLNWIIAHAPALTRGSILMNHEDVANLAGDDDGDQLWFSFRCDDTFQTMLTVKEQAQNATPYAIENNKKAQQPSAVGGQRFDSILTARGADLDAMVRFIMAPNKGQGPVGYLANLCTILITFFDKVEDEDGGMKFENIWVERLQAVLNHLQQTAIDTQKREFISECLHRWTLAKLEKERLSGRSLVPGYDFPGHGVASFDAEGFDPVDFTPEQYQRAVGVIDGSDVMIPHHQSGQLIPVLTPTDSQYNISALGSWLIWECASLLCTGKPCDWGADMHEAAKGGLKPMEFEFITAFEAGVTNIYSGDFNGDDVAAAYDIGGATNLYVSLAQDYPEVDQVALKALCVEKPRELYAWKTQSKAKPFAVKAPPALELNHEIALMAKRSHVPSGDCPAIDFNVLQAKLLKLMSVKMDAKQLKMFLAQALEAFYTEAAMSNEAKSTSEKMQSASERSGIEVLRLLIEALENWSTQFKIQRKLALGIADAINPRLKTPNKNKAIALVAMLFAWYEQVEAGFWAFDFCLKEVEAQHESLKSTPGRAPTKATLWSQLFGGALTDKEARSAALGLRSKLRRDSEFLARCEVVADTLSPRRAEQLRARATWFIDEGLSCLVKAKDRQAIVSSKRDILRSLSQTVADWHHYRPDWSDEQASLEILVSTFLSGEALWLDPIKEKLSALAELELGAEEIKNSKLEIRRLKNSDEEADIERVSLLKSDLRRSRRGKAARATLTLIESAATAVSAEKPFIIDILCNPKSNPLAKEFVAGLKANSGAIVNVERAWRRAPTAHRDYVELWTEELGSWYTPKKRRRSYDGEPMSKPKRKLMANSRVDWSLSVEATGAFTRILLDGGVSFYKLTKLPLRDRQTWRYFSAFVAATESLSDWQLTHGFGHLVSLAIPVELRGVKTPSGQEKYARVEHVKLLESTIDDNSNVNFEALNPADAKWLNAQLEGCKAEKARIESLSDHPLMASWGSGLLFPCTWGWAQRSYAGQLTAKKLNNRAANALITLGGEDFMPKPKTETIEVDDRQVEVNLVTNKLQPNWDLVRRHQPWLVVSNDYSSRVRSMNSSLELDDEQDLNPFELTGAQSSYSEWLDEICLLAARNSQATCEGLTAAGLWFQSNVGRLMVIDPNHSLYDEEVAGKIRRKLLSCPSYDARIHIEDLLKSETWVAPRYNRLTEEAAIAFFALLNELTS